MSNNKFLKFLRAIFFMLLISISMKSFAAIVASTPNLSGNIAFSGFGDATPTTFSASLTNLSGSLNLLALADGHYTVLGEGSVFFQGHPGAGGTIDQTVNPAVPLYTGFLGSTGLTPGFYNFNFGSALPGDILIDFSIQYDGAASSQVMGFLMPLGFINPDGSGILNVSGVFSADGTSAVFNFIESDLTWSGFGGALLAADQLFGGGDGIIDGPFSLSNVSVVAVSEPQTLLLLFIGLCILSLIGARKYSQADRFHQFQEKDLAIA